MSVIVLSPAAPTALMPALAAGVGRVQGAGTVIEAAAAGVAPSRACVVVDLRGGALDDAERLRLLLPATRILALVPPGGDPPPECDAVLTAPFYLDEVVRWCRRALTAPMHDGVIADLAAGLSHEVGNPLTALMLEIELLRTEASSTPFAEHLDAIEEAGRRIQQVVSDVSLASERQPIKPMPTRLGQLVEDAHATLGARNPEFARRIDLHCEDVALAAERPLVSGALADLWQYLLLAGEADDTLAIDAGSRDAGTLSIRARAHVPRLPDDAASRIFVPLWARQALGLPAGISLTSARAVFQRHGGDVRARPAAGDSLLVDAILPRDAAG